MIRKKPLQARKIVSKPRKRRKKGDITKAKEKLWGLIREIVKKRYDYRCYTCDKVPTTGKGLHAGHFITSSLCSIPMRYDLRNIRPQCFHCNINLSGNWVEFEKRLKEEGQNTELLKVMNLATKGYAYPLPWFESKIAQYTLILTALK